MGNSGRVATGVIIFIILVALVSISFLMILPACGSVMGWLGLRFNECPQTAVNHEKIDLRAEEDRRIDLLDRIAQLEDEIAAVQCPIIYDGSEPYRPSTKGPDFAEDSQSQERFQNRDVGVLEGCWQLEETLTTFDVNTNEPTVFDDWQVCFDENGQGTQRMVSRNGGDTCEGAVEGNFTEDGELLIAEPGNLECSSGMFIYRRDTRCSVEPNGFLSCRTRQPELSPNERDPFRMQSE